VCRAVLSSLACMLRASQAHQRHTLIHSGYCFDQISIVTMKQLTAHQHKAQNQVKTHSNTRTIGIRGRTSAAPKGDILTWHGAAGTGHGSVSRYTQPMHVCTHTSHVCMHTHKPCMYAHIQAMHVCTHTSHARMHTYKGTHTR